MSAILFVLVSPKSDTTASIKVLPNHHRHQFLRIYLNTHLPNVNRDLQSSKSSIKTSLQIQTHQKDWMSQETSRSIAIKYYRVKLEYTIIKRPSRSILCGLSRQNQTHLAKKYYLRKLQIRCSISYLTFPTDLISALKLKINLKFSKLCNRLSFRPEYSAF